MDRLQISEDKKAHQERLVIRDKFPKNRNKKVFRGVCPCGWLEKSVTKSALFARFDRHLRGGQNAG